MTNAKVNYLVFGNLNNVNKHNLMQIGHEIGNT